MAEFEEGNRGGLAWELKGHCQTKREQRERQRVGYNLKFLNSRRTTRRLHTRVPRCWFI